MIWFALAFLSVIALGLVMPPLLRRPQPANHARDLAVYRDQLKELEADLERGVISAAEAEAARTEIKRRILAVPLAAAPSQSAPSRAAAIAVASAVVAVSLATYLTLGRPTLPSSFFEAKAEREATADEMLAEINQMVERLAAKLKAQPNDAQGWRMLGWSYVQLGRVKEGIDALARAVTLDPENAALRAQYGEALVQDAGGNVTPDALAAFDEALKHDAKDPRARFYKGLSLVQSGKEREALDLWTQVIREAPADADWLPGLRAQAQELATKLKRDPKVTVPQ
ncbi:MAG: c-type cytochrome biogenesis protein CcmI [Alphaproteobacteria bacterium]|nr:c-type cytochrome biogenesis protein CcmI [Alphaproteobacteria bacterium]